MVSPNQLEPKVLCKFWNINIHETLQKPGLIRKLCRFTWRMFTSLLGLGCIDVSWEQVKPTPADAPLFPPSASRTLWGPSLQGKLAHHDWLTVHKIETSSLNVDT
eukprot:3482303-Amphidinium_carterae.1